MNRNKRPMNEQKWWWYQSQWSVLDWQSRTQIVGHFSHSTFLIHNDIEKQWNCIWMQYLYIFSLDRYSTSLLESINIRRWFDYEWIYLYIWLIWTNQLKCKICKSIQTWQYKMTTCRDVSVHMWVRWEICWYKMAFVKVVSEGECGSAP